MAKQTLKQRKAIRSAAAKKGWSTRKARKYRENLVSLAAMDQEFQEALRRTENTHILQPREMIPNDIETATLRCHRVRAQVEREFAAARPPSLWKRVRDWLRARRLADGI